MKHVLITGGSEGLGRALAEKLQAAEFTVTILAQNAAKTKGAATVIGCSYVIADVSNADQLRAAIAEAEQQNGPIDVLVNNAGVWLQGPLADNDTAAIHRLIEVNTLGLIYATKFVAPAMQARGGGRIINVSSQAGLYGKAERSVYHASKWAVTGFTKSMQMELKPSKVTVTGFYPGAMDTTLFKKAGNARDMSRALDVRVAAEALAYICALPDEVDVPEFGIQNINY